MNDFHVSMNVFIDIAYSKTVCVQIHVSKSTSNNIIIYAHTYPKSLLSALATH